MKIYFAGSISGNYDNFYTKIINLLKQYDKVLTEHITDKNLSFIDKTKLSNEKIYKIGIKWLETADIIIAEVTTPSLGVGYELGKTENKKPILCIYRKKSSSRLSAM